MKDGQAILGPMEGLADVFEGIGWETELFWDLLKAYPTCLRGLIGGRAVLRLMEGLADVYEGVGWGPTCSETYGGLGRRV